MRMDVSPAELAYQEAVRAISAQAGSIDSLRGQTSALLGAGSVATAFLGAQGVGRQGLTGWGLVATLCFVIVGVLTVGLLFPRDGWAFSLAPAAVVESYSRQAAPSVEQLYYEFAVNLDTQFDANADRLRWMFWAFRIASIFLVLGVLAWITELATK
jgi:hypothetical protein